MAQDWTNLLKIRQEVIATDGGVGDLQMSLHRAVYQTAKAPYQDVAYYGDITEPIPSLVGFFARIARRLSKTNESTALYHLDQGMGGGKSHALVGLYHMASNPKGFFETQIGKEVFREASAGGSKIDISNARVVTLTADHFSPGKATETFGPAINLFERFLWSLFQGDRAKYDAAAAEGANKATIQKALTSVGGPVLILLDELMDYAMALSSVENVGAMPAEQAFINALMDACDDVPSVAFVLVMIRTELDPEGYTTAAESFREYLSARINRNGTTVAVTETGDFAAIIRRRIFEQANFVKAASDLAKEYQKAIAADPAWESQVLDKMGTAKGSATLEDRITATYPFHPDLMDLVQNEWGKTQGFQRVRSTVSIFALAALHWTRVGDDGGWTPALIGVGDLPIAGIKSRGNIAEARCLEALLSSGLLLGNDRAIQGYRAVATTDITSADGKSGQAIEIDRKLEKANVDAGQPHPAVRMASALFNYSLVPRSQGRRGATKAELMAALLLPAKGKKSAFSSVEEVFTALCGADGLGALEANRSSSNQVERYWLTIHQTLRMFFNSAKNHVTDEQAFALAWDTAQELQTKGQFEQICDVQRPNEKQTLSEVAGGFDSQETRLLVLDLRQWTLLNGEDSRSREDIRSFLGVGSKALVVDNAASCVVAAVNTYQRRYAIQAAHDVLTWKVVSEQVIEDKDREQVASELSEARQKLKETIRKAYRHYAYLTRKGDQLEVVFARFDDDKQSALDGNDVWSALVVAGRAVGEYLDTTEKRRKRKHLSEEYVAMLLDGFNRHLTPKDVVSSFCKNPRFPMVPNLDEIRNVVFNLLQEPDHAGPGTGGWELVDSNNTALNVDNPGQIAINSSQQQIRRRQEQQSGESDDNDYTLGRTDEHTDSRWLESGDDSDRQSGQSSSTKKDEKQNGETKRPAEYAWYGVELTNRSIVDDSKRDEVQKHLRWLIAQLDDQSLDPQLITLKYEFMAGANQDLTADIESRATSLGAKASIRNDP